MENLNSYLQPGNAVLAGELSEKIETICYLAKELDYLIDCMNDKGGLFITLKGMDKMKELFHEIENQLGVSYDEFTQEESENFYQNEEYPPQPPVVQNLEKALPSFANGKLSLILLPSGILVEVSRSREYPCTKIHFKPQERIEAVNNICK